LDWANGSLSDSIAVLNAFRVGNGINSVIEKLNKTWIVKRPL